MLLNYRFQPKPAHRISFAEAVKGKIDDELIRDRIVLIGVTDKQLGQDYRKTPYGELPGVWIHAHGISQVLGAVMDNRALLWVLPQWSWIQWGDILWIWAWAVMGGLLVWRMRSTLLLVGASLAASLCLHQICLFILVQGGWLPFVPALLALVGTAGVLLARRHGYLQIIMDRLFKRLTWKPLVIKRK
ncbi:MAG: CHASE2 domain-containing protein [Cyanobacteria bacterium J06626_26]